MILNHMPLRAGMGLRIVKLTPQCSQDYLLPHSGAEVSRLVIGLRGPTGIAYAAATKLMTREMMPGI
jgi:hypothetical protein